MLPLGNTNSHLVPLSLQNIILVYVLSCPTLPCCSQPQPQPCRCNLGETHNNFALSMSPIILGQDLRWVLSNSVLDPCVYFATPLQQLTQQRSLLWSFACTWLPSAHPSPATFILPRPGPRVHSCPRGHPCSCSSRTRNQYARC